MATGIRNTTRGRKKRDTTVSPDYQQLIHRRREGIQMVKILKNKHFWLVFGAQWNTFSLGLSIGKFGFTLDLGFIWMSVEW